MSSERKPKYGEKHDAGMLRLYRAAIIIGVVNVLLLALFTAIFNNP